MNDKPKSPHSGIDLKADYGTPIASSSDGNVAYIGDFFFSGNSVFIDHGMGIFTMYFHLSDMVVKQGDSVKQGQVIGHAGSTGRSTGPHLHWGLRINDLRINPLSIISLFEEME
jgi:murein DD-endopeptidase MepM/ murein hydrolase activator NlpD